MNLEDIRKDIDQIDKQLVELILKRMDCSRRVAQYKKDNDLPVLDASREAAILDKVAEMGGEHGDAMRMIYSAIMEQSKALQYPFVENKSVREFAPLKPHLKVKSIACQGIAGAYSGLAGATLYPNAEITYCESFAEVCRLVKEGKVEYGVLPVENSWAGSVHEVYDLLISGKFLIAESIDAVIHHNLIGCKGAKISDIKRVVSHPQALRQCAETVEGIGATPTECSNTAVAVKLVADGMDKSVGAIGSAQAAKIYGLEIIKSNIASSSFNTTRFISISSVAQRCDDADKISIVFTVSGHDKAGSLLTVLEHFASCNMSLTKIESRPIKNSQFEYVFYADFNGNLKEPKVAGVLATLAEELPEFVLLGNYREGLTQFE